MSQQVSIRPAVRKRRLQQAMPRKGAARAVQRTTDLIGRIYDCALDPGRWEATLASINSAMGFTNSALGLISLHAGVQSLDASAGIDSEWLAVGESYSADAVALWGGAARAEQFPLDEPIIYSQQDNYESRHANRYYRDVLEPRGMVDTLMLLLARDRSLVGYAGFNRDETAGLMGADEVEAMRILGPHFRRAVTISNIFDLQRIEVATFGAVLDSFAFGVVLVDDRLAIVHANQAAATLLAARDPIRSDRGLLGLVEPAANAAVQRAVRDAVADQIQLGAKGIGIPIRSAEGLTFVVHVLPLHSGEMRRSVGPQASAVLFVMPAETPQPMPTDALALLYDLTPAETRTLELLVAGVTRAGIGATLGIAPSTVKSHIVHLFDKTGCRRQIDLVRLAAGMSLPVSAGLVVPH